MTNVECRMTKESRIPNDQTGREPFGLQVLIFFRHSTFDIRHSTLS